MLNDLPLQSQPPPARDFKPRTRLRAWIEDNLDLPNARLAEKAALYFERDAEMLAWAMKLATIWERAGVASRVRKKQMRLLAEADSGTRSLELLTLFQETNGIEFQSVLKFTRPEGLAYCDQREEKIRGEIRHVSLVRDLFESLPNDTITPLEFYADNERTLAEIFQRHEEVL